MSECYTPLYKHELKYQVNVCTSNVSFQALLYTSRVAVPVMRGGCFSILPYGTLTHTNNIHVLNMHTSARRKGMSARLVNIRGSNYILNNEYLLPYYFPLFCWSTYTYCN